MKQHGLTQTPEYDIWSAMIQRCTNPRHKKYHLYGQRGISVCNRWRDFLNFYTDMGPRPSPNLSLDRINNDGNYEPGNCRWTTSKVQANNSRKVTSGVARLAREHGMKVTTVHNRLFRGWSLQEALSTPWGNKRRA
jgi:hypothetical protein